MGSELDHSVSELFYTYGLAVVKVPQSELASISAVDLAVARAALSTSGPKSVFSIAKA
jgi:hypothetical protein